MSVEVETKDWHKMDSWWKVHGEAHQKRIVELYELMEELSKEWKQSDCRFDQDPLVEDWSDESRKTGPIRPGLEENWSYWLAHLFRTPTGDFTKNLFGDRFDDKPEEVQCELVFYDEGGKDRRADILLKYETKGISIEVKIGDTNYGKTPHTANLIENDDDREWDHYILVPRSKKSLMKAILGSNFQDHKDPYPTILSKKYPNIDVIYWRDVSQALRRTLLYGKNEDLHWQSSAYLFINLIEQKISKIYNKNFVERNVVKEREPTFSDIKRIRSIETQDQIEYFKEVLR